MNGGDQRARQPAALFELKRYLRDAHGSAAVEFVLWLAVLIVPVLSAVDVGTYAYNRMLVQIAGQAAVQAVWHNCDARQSPSQVPATSKCTTPSTALLTIVTAAAQATTLGTAVTTSNTDVTEGYYCASAGQVLTLAAPTTGSLAAPLTIPAPNCPGTTTKAADYIQVKVTYTYAPVFSNLSVGPYLTTPITYQAWMRLS
jgi:Flp pilus assembly protein TadG